MKHIPFSELALLSLPVVLIGGVGYFYSRAKPTQAQEPLRLTFHIEKPTTLEAFAGSNVALVVGMAGKNAEKLRLQHVNHVLKANTKRGIMRFDDGGDSRLISNTKSNGKNWRLTINEDVIPLGDLSINCNATIAPASGMAPKVLPYKEGRWKIDRTKITSFPFKQMPRKPLVTLKSVTVTQTAGYFSAKSVFSLDGVAMTEKTSFDANLRSRRYGMGYETNFNPQKTARLREIEWSIFTSIGGMTYVSGRVSADERWPLAFEIEPFNTAKVKVGQKLRFKAFPASLPKK